MDARRTDGRIATKYQIGQSWWIFATVRQNRQSSITNHQLSIINHQLQITNYQSSISNGIIANSSDQPTDTDAAQKPAGNYTDEHWDKQPKSATAKAQPKAKAKQNKIGGWSLGFLL
jgi:hypothetical protein